MPPIPDLDFLLSLPDEERKAELARLSGSQRRALRTHWQLWAHPGQRAPEGDWQRWLIMAGRGFGKTRAGAEWVRGVAEADPTARARAGCWRSRRGKSVRASNRRSGW